MKKIFKVDIFNNVIRSHKLFIIGIVFISFTFSFCGDNKVDKDQLASELPGVMENSEKPDLDTNFLKYSGFYEYKNGNVHDYILVSKFPVNSVVHPEKDYDSGPEGYPLEKSFIGKYFIYHTKWKHDTTWSNGAESGPYWVPNSGTDAGNQNLLVGVDKNTGAIYHQNYNIFNSKGALEFTSEPGKGDYGKFVKREDGKYNLLTQNMLYLYIEE